MRLLFLSHYFPPEINAPASRTYEHCKVWAAAGHKVTVVTCFPNHPAGIIYPPYRNRLWQREERDGIDVIRLLTYATANEGFAVCLELVVNRLFGVFWFFFLVVPNRIMFSSIESIVDATGLERS